MQAHGNDVIIFSTIDMVTAKWSSTTNKDVENHVVVTYFAGVSSNVIRMVSLKAFTDKS